MSDCTEALSRCVLNSPAGVVPRKFSDSSLLLPAANCTATRSPACHFSCAPTTCCTMSELSTKLPSYSFSPLTRMPWPCSTTDSPMFTPPRSENACWV